MYRVLFRIPLPFTIPGIGVHEISIYSYGFMLAIGFLVGIVIGHYRARREGVDSGLVWDTWTACFIAGILGARLFYYVQNYRQEFAGQPLYKALEVWQGGLVFYGGVIGAFLASWLVVKLRGGRFLQIADISAPSLAVGVAFGRIGCFLNGCCWGCAAPAGAWYGVSFPPMSPPAVAYAVPGSEAIQWSPPLVPSQLISAAAVFAIFLALTFFYRHRHRYGEVFVMFLMLYAPARYGLEWIRNETPKDFLWHTPGQLVSIAMFVPAAAAFTYLRWLSKGPTAAECAAADRAATARHASPVHRKKVRRKA